MINLGKITKMDYVMLGVFIFSQIINVPIQLYPNYIQFPIIVEFYLLIALFVCYLVCGGYFGVKLLKRMK